VLAVVALFSHHAVEVAVFLFVSLAHGGSSVRLSGTDLGTAAGHERARGEGQGRSYGEGKR